MMPSEQPIRGQIVREIVREVTSSPEASADGTSRIVTQAEFKLDGKWLCCRAWVEGEGGSPPMIEVRSTALSVEEALIVSIALRQALDWIAEEARKTEPTVPLGDSPG